MASVKVTFMVMSIIYIVYGHPHHQHHLHGGHHAAPKTEYHGLDYDVPMYGLPKVELVEPRLGAQATLLSKDGRSFHLITGGLYYLPSDWPAAFANISKFYDTAVQELNVYAFNDRRSSFIYGPWQEMNNPRAFHVAEQYEDEIYVWGGGSTTLEKYSIEGDFWQFQNEREETQYFVNYEPIGEWTELETSGDVPSNRYGSASIVIGSDIYVFGGQSDDGNVANTLHTLNLDSLVWTLITSAEEPEARYGASFNYHNGDLYLFGGRNSDDESVSTMWKFNLASQSWSEVSYADGEPRAAAFHASFVYDDHIVIVLGEGNDATDNTWRDIDIFNVNLREWTRLEKPFSSPVPPTRSGFTYVAELGEIVLFNGVRDTGNHDLDSYTVSAEVWTLDFVNLVWRGRQCYPGYSYNTESATCISTSYDDCYTCQDCVNMDQQRRNYVHGLRMNIKDLKFDGSLRQCPAMWRGGK